MDIKSAKFQHAIQMKMGAYAQNITFISPDKFPSLTIAMSFDPTTQLLTVTVGASSVMVPVTNILYMEELPAPVEFMVTARKTSAK